MKRPFEIGDRVRVYEGQLSFAATVELRQFDGNLQVRAKGAESTVTVHPKQCRRLKPKPKPVKKEALRVWIGKRSKYVFKVNPTDCDATEFREVLPGEVVVTLEALAKAWDENVADGHAISHNEGSGSSGRFKALAKALGLEHSF